MRFTRTGRLFVHSLLAATEEGIETARFLVAVLDRAAQLLELLGLFLAGSADLVEQPLLAPADECKQPARLLVPARGEAP